MLCEFPRLGTQFEESDPDLGPHKPIFHPQSHSPVISQKQVSTELSKCYLNENIGARETVECAELGLHVADPGLILALHNLSPEQS